MTEQVIKPGEIIRGKLDRQLTTVEDVSAHIQKRGSLFINKLASLALRNFSEKSKQPIGWQRITKERNKLVKSDIVDPMDPDSLFTSRGLCDFAAFALADAVKRISNGLNVRVVRILTDMNAEKWDDPNYTVLTYGHSLVEITQEGNQPTFIDPTYGQIDHRKTGTILIAPLSDLSKYYKADEEWSINDFEHAKNDVLTSLYKRQYSEKAYTKIVETLL